MTEDQRRIWLEYKATEGFRVQSVLGALGALPAAALVFGDAAASVAPGAPLYCAAIVLLIGAYMHWNYTDGTFYLDMVHDGAGAAAAARKWADDVYRSGLRSQTMTFAYGFASLICTLGGVAAVYGGLRTGITVRDGFVAVMVLAVAVFADIFASNLRRNVLVEGPPTEG